MEPLCRLTGQDTEFNWTEEQENAFTEVKHLVTTAPVLSYYDPKGELEIPVWCQQERPRSCPPTKRPTDRVHKQSTHWNQAAIHADREGDVRDRILTWEIQPVHLQMPCENPKWPQATRIHPEEVCHVCTKMPSRYDDETSEIWLRGAVWGWHEPIPGQYTLQSIPADHCTLDWSWIWEHQHQVLRFSLYTRLDSERSSKQLRMTRSCKPSKLLSCMACLMIAANYQSRSLSTSVWGMSWQYTTEWYFTGSES